ncbi:MAG: DUF1993 domain-containing protein [Burkholderiales bacterium]
MATMYQITVPLYMKHLNGLAGCIKKTQSLYAEKKYDETTLLNYRFYPDMFSFTRQVQFATDHAKGCTALLAGVEAPKFEDNEKSLAELLQRIEKTNAWLSSINAQQIDGTEEKSVTVKRPTGEVQMKGLELVLHRSMPNFMFHCTTAYDIMRHNGVEIGKRDFMGS